MCKESQSEVTSKEKPQLVQIVNANHFKLHNWTHNLGVPTPAEPDDLVDVTYVDGTTELGKMAKNIAWSRVDTFSFHVVRYENIREVRIDNIDKAAVDELKRFIDGKQRLGDAYKAAIDDGKAPNPADGLLSVSAMAIPLMHAIDEKKARAFLNSGSTKREHNHYFKDVSHLNSIDVYRVLDLFNVTNPCLQHAIKKLLVAGARGHKDINKDVHESIVALQRWQEMQTENGNEE